jgi:hypothetical protein
MVDASIDIDFYTKNKLLLDELMEQYNTNCQQIINKLTSVISGVFREETGWVVFVADKYIQLYKALWDDKKLGSKKGAICYEIGFFDCNGQKGLFDKNVKLSVSVYVASSCVKQQILCDFIDNSVHTITSILSQLQEFDQKFTDNIDMAFA